ncbi:MAG: serine/threonine protein kinase [Anaerolineae bacterium]|nr:serine/threonine protein kinase [Phycisphaerae bacterium]
MDSDAIKFADIAQKYIGTGAPLARLGWGISGYVYLAPDLRTAVKVLKYSAGFQAEVRTYQLLRRLGMRQLLGFTIPRMLDYREDILAIQMDFVRSPYLLDFAGVQFKKPDFSGDVMAHWHQKISEFFSPNEAMIYAVYAALARHGIYYMDFRPSNINMTGHPEAKAPEKE